MTGTLKLHRRIEVLVLVVFLAVIAVPGLATTMALGRGNPAEENRTPAAFPAVAWTWPSMRAFPDAFTKFFEDNFAFRPVLVRAQAWFRLKMLAVSPSPAVLRGREGWLFYAEDGAMEDYASAPPLSPQELEIWRQTLTDTHDWLKARGVTYLFVIAPDKHEIYPEEMPAAIRRHPVSRIDQLTEYLHAHTDVPVLDLRPALQDAKRRERIYHRTDTHWNDRGAFVGYGEILSALGGAVPGLQPLPRESFAAREVHTSGLDLAGMLGLTRSLEEVDLRLVPLRPRRARVVEPKSPNPYGIEGRMVTEAPDPALPRAVIFRDSFASALIPFVAEHFSRAVWLWQYNMDPDVIRAERPDVVIQEWVGRRLSTLLPYDPVPDARDASR